MTMPHGVLCFVVPDSCGPQFRIDVLTVTPWKIFAAIIRVEYLSSKHLATSFV